MNRSKTLLTEALVAVLLLSLFITVSAYGADAFSVTYEVHPGKGNVNTNILIMVRVNPVYSPEPMWIYTFWEDKVVVQRLGSPYNPDNGLFERRWDLVITPPAEFEYSDLGNHMIYIKVENSAGEFVTKYWQWNIVEFIPPGDWWDDLPQEFFDRLTGPEGAVGPKGDTGRTGGDGRRGLKGDDGDDGEDGVDGALGPVGPPGESMPGTQGLIGEPGVKGETGDTGPAGEGVDMMVLYAIVGAVFVSLLLSVNNALTIRSARKAAEKIEA